MLKLENLILDTFDEKKLYNLDINYPFLNIYDEWVKRMNTCNPNLYLPLLEYIINGQIKKTFEIQKSLNKIGESFPWKIAVIYDYRTGHIKSIEIRIGNKFGKYNVSSKPICFNWLYVNSNKLLMREIVSSNSVSTYLSLQLNEEMSEKVRNLLLTNENLSLDVLIVKSENGYSFQSIPNSNPLLEGEGFIVYPFMLFSEYSSIQLRQHINDSEILRCENISIKTSYEVKKYLQINL